MTGEAEFTGLIRALTLPAVGASPRFRIQIDNDEGALDVIFVGYRMLPGFRGGREVTVRGTIAPGANPTMYNPTYWLKAETV